MINKFLIGNSFFRGCNYSNWIYLVNLYTYPAQTAETMTRSHSRKIHNSLYVLHNLAIVISRTSANIVSTRKVNEDRAKMNFRVYTLRRYTHTHTHSLFNPLIPYSIKYSGQKFSPNRYENFVKVAENNFFFFLNKHLEIQLCKIPQR